MVLCVLIFVTWQRN